MKTFRLIALIALLAMAALAACAEPITAPTARADGGAALTDGQGFMGGGTRE
jgi:hypothetical protein